MRGISIYMYNEERQKLSHTHEIIHFSSIYYQNLIVIRCFSKNLLSIKSVKLFLRPSTSRNGHVDLVTATR